ncbi:MAG: DNA alkylation repair protein [Chloroflexota bacterium]
MPAIRPSFLKSQISQLLEHFESPTNFTHELHGLLDYYADRTRRTTTVSGSANFLRQYFIPKPVLSAVEQMLIPGIVGNPKLALALADKLWGEDWVECRIIAIFILGGLPPQPTSIILDRIERWGSTCKETSITKALASQGLGRLYREEEDTYYQALETWLVTDQHPLLKVGLEAVPTLIADQYFENLPLLFRWLAPLFRDGDIELKDQFNDIIRALAVKAPGESTRFLRKILVSSTNRRASAAVIRGALDAFPPAMRAQLEEVIRQPKP